MVFTLSFFSHIFLDSVEVNIICHCLWVEGKGTVVLFHHRPLTEGEENNGKMKRVAEQKRKVDQEIETV